jgi:hypothetical protein
MQLTSRFNMGVSDKSGSSLIDCIFDDLDKEERLVHPKKIVI